MARTLSPVLMLVLSAILMGLRDSSSEIFKTAISELISKPMILATFSFPFAIRTLTTLPLETT